MFTPVSRRQTAPRFEVVRKAIEQTQFVVGMRGVSRHDPRRSAFRLMSVMLGENMSSRLFQNVREKHGLAYSISTGANYYQETGSFYINAGVENSKTAQAIKLTLQTVRATGPTRAECAGIAAGEGIYLRADAPEPGEHRQPDDVAGRGIARP